MDKNLVEIIDTTTGETKIQKMLAKQVWEMDKKFKVKVKINKDGVVGTNESLLVTRFLGEVARRKDYLPIDVDEWSLMPKSIKDRCWELIKAKFSFDYDVGEYWVLRNLAPSWKRWKYNLREKYLKSNRTKEEILENTPHDVDKVQWSKFVDHYQSDRMKEISEINTQCRKKLMINHTGGSKSNKRKAHEMEAKLGRPVCRAEVVVQTWLRKDGSYSTEYAKKAADKILYHLAQDQEYATTSDVHSTIYAHPYDAIGKVLGPEQRGRVRGLGIGISPSRKFGYDVGLTLKKKLLILDIHGVLADIPYHKREVFTPDISIGNQRLRMRPYCREFLQFCFEKFEVAIWSSKQSGNVRDFIKFLFGNMEEKLLFVWDGLKCTKSRVPTPENSNKTMLFKDLKNVWNDRRFERFGFNDNNTLLVDDSPYKALLNPPHTAVFPHTYHWQTTDNVLGINGELRIFLDGLANDVDVQGYVRTHRFGQAYINEENEHWECYKKAIDEVTASIVEV